MTIDRRRMLKAGGFALALMGLGLAGHLKARDSYGAMPSLSGASQWLNSPPVDAPGLKGKVVLVDFWTWDCINCRRSLPHVNDWARRYADQGLVVVGVHTPEFDYEHDVATLRDKVARLGIGYPVAVDNDYRCGMPGATSSGRRITLSTARGRCAMCTLARGIMASRNR